MLERFLSVNCIQFKEHGCVRNSRRTERLNHQHDRDKDNNKVDNLANQVLTLTAQVISLTASLAVERDQREEVEPAGRTTRILHRS